MESNNRNGKKKLTKLGEEVDEALRKATQEALKKHKLAGNPIAVWKNSKLVLLEPDEIILQ